MSGMKALLERGATVLRCPGCRRSTLHVTLRGLTCGECGQQLTPRPGWIDFLQVAAHRPSLGQRFFLNPAGARLYAAVRETPAAWLMNRRSFRDEVNTLFEGLALRPTATVVDVPCGHGNFTVELAREAPEGLVIGVDVAETMLAMASRKVAEAGLKNVLLLRASALDLPLTDESMDAFSSCGGLHLYPDLRRAVVEMRRVLAFGGRVAGLAFAASPDLSGRVVEEAARQVSGINALDFEHLSEDFAAAGFRRWQWEKRGFVAYFSASAS